MRLFSILLAVSATLFLCQCSSSPTKRIEKNPEIFSALSIEEQDLASNGRIGAGMSPGGVYLALGTPDRKLEGFEDGTNTMRWDYNRLSPVYINNFYGGFGTGFGRFGGRRGGFGRRGGIGGFGGFGFGPSVAYVPSRSGTVWFEENRVKSWEQVRP